MPSAVRTPVLGALSFLLIARFGKESKVRSRYVKEATAAEQKCQDSTGTRGYKRTCRCRNPEIDRKKAGRNAPAVVVTGK